MSSQRLRCELGRRHGCCWRRRRLCFRRQWWGTGVIHRYQNRTGRAGRARCGVTYQVFTGIIHSPRRCPAVSIKELETPHIYDAGHGNSSDSRDDASDDEAQITSSPAGCAIHTPPPTGSSCGLACACIRIRQGPHVALHMHTYARVLMWPCIHTPGSSCGLAHAYIRQGPHVALHVHTYARVLMWPCICTHTPGSSCGLAHAYIRQGPHVASHGTRARRR